MAEADNFFNESESPPPLSAKISLNLDKVDASYVQSQQHLLQPSVKNPLPNTVPPPIAALAGNIGERHVLVMLGLPCRGKTFTSRRLQRYLQFFHGANCKRFDVCRYPKGRGGVDLYQELSYFLSELDNKDACDLMDDPGKKNVDSGRVAILFSSDTSEAFLEPWSGTSKERRRVICEKLAGLPVRVKVVFMELVVTEEKLVNQNVLRKVQSDNNKAAVTPGGGPAQESPQEGGGAAGHPAQHKRKDSLLGVPFRDAGIDAEDYERFAAEISDIKKKILDFQRKFVTMQEDGSEDDLSYIKLINYGEKMVTNNIHGYLPMRIVQFLSNIHTKPHSIYITRHGQSEYNVKGQLGGNPPLSPFGQKYAHNLAQFAEEVVCKDENQEEVPARLWTSCLQRTIKTAEHIKHPVICEGSWEQMAPRVYRNLDEIFAGEYEGMTYAEIEKMQPLSDTGLKESELRKIDKIGYRYPRGESYFDLIARLDPLVHELESYKEPVLIVSHQATLRIIYSYFMDIDRELAPKQKIPLHTVIKMTYDGWMRCSEEHFPLGPDVPSTDI